MKKIFTLIAAAFMSVGMFAQNGMVELSWDTMVKDEAGTNAADQNNITFEGADGFALKPVGGRAQGKSERQGCTKVLNFKNNTNQTLVIPPGTKVYKINFYGWSQGDNWTYLYAYGPQAGAWEWTDPIGSGIQDNKVIIEQAKYPMDPCVVNSANAKNGYSPFYHKAGYCFASLDFSDEPYEGEFSFVFNGNNQERAWMEVYLTKEAAAAAPAAEPVVQDLKTVIGKEDNTTSWWEDFSEYYTLEKDKTLHLEFKNYSNKGENWFNWLGFVTSDADRAVNNTGYYHEFFAIRADNYGWGDQWDDGVLTSNYDWATFKDEMDGSDVVLEVMRQGDKITITADITAANGTKRQEKYVGTTAATWTVGEMNENNEWQAIKNEETGEDFTLTRGGDDKIRFFLTVEGGHLVVSDLKTTITDSPEDTETGINAVATKAKSGQRFNLAGQKVNASYQGIVFENGKKYLAK